MRVLVIALVIVDFINANFLASHLENAINSIFTIESEPAPTEFPVSKLDQTCHRCSVNTEDRTRCRRNRKTMKPYPCRKRGCCYDWSAKQCYRPSKKKCASPRCEAVTISKRVVWGEIGVKAACPECWDGKRGTCFKPAKPYCPLELDENVEYKRCGWRRIKKKFCELNEDCCWNKEKKLCHYSVPEVTTTPLVITLMTEPNTTIPPETTEAIVVPIAVDPDLTDDEHGSDGEHGSERVDVTSILDNKQAIKDMQFSAMNHANQVCQTQAQLHIRNQAAMIECQRTVFKARHTQLVSELCAEKFMQARPTLKCVTLFEQEFPMHTVQFPRITVPVTSTTTQPVSNLGFTQLIAQKEAERRCEERYFDGDKGFQAVRAFHNAVDFEGYKGPTELST